MNIDGSISVFVSSDDVRYVLLQSSSFRSNCSSFNLGINSSYSFNEIVSGISFNMVNKSTDVIDGIARSITSFNSFNWPS
jgi:hypothetical protein